MMTRAGRRPSASVAMISSTLVGGGELDRRLRKVEALSAQTHLRDGFFARDVEDALAAHRHRGACLREQRRLADAGLAAEQQHRSGDETAAGDAIKFGNAGLDARGRAARPG